MQLLNAVAMVPAIGYIGRTTANASLLPSPVQIGRSALRSRSTMPIMGRMQLLSVMREHNREKWAALCLSAIEATNGRLQLAAKRLKVPLRTLKRWVSQDPEFQHAPHAPRGWPKGKPRKEA